MCGRNLRFPHTRPLPFCDTIQFAIETDRSCHRQGPGAELRSGLFSLPQSALPFQPIRTFPDQRRHPKECLLLVCTTGFPKTALPESMPQSGTPQLFTLLYSLFTRPAPAFPSHSLGAPESCSAGGGGSVPRRQCGTAKRPFPRTAPHAGHRLILNPCRRAALRNYSLFTLLYSLSQPCPLFPPGRTAKQKYILFFGHLTHNSARYNIGLNLIMEGKEYGKTGSA